MMVVMTIELDPSDPLYEPLHPPNGKARTPKRRRIPHSEVSWAKTERTTLMSRRFDAVYPPLTRLYLFLRIRSADGRFPVRLTNEAAHDIGLSPDQKQRYLKRLEQAGLISIEQYCGVCPVVTMLVAK